MSLRIPICNLSNLPRFLFPPGALLPSGRFPDSIGAHLAGGGTVFHQGAPAARLEPISANLAAYVTCVLADRSEELIPEKGFKTSWYCGKTEISRPHSHFIKLRADDLVEQASGGVPDWNGLQDW